MDNFKITHWAYHLGTLGHFPSLKTLNLAAEIWRVVSWSFYGLCSWMPAPNLGINQHLQWSFTSLPPELTGHTCQRTTSPSADLESWLTASRQSDKIQNVILSLQETGEQRKWQATGITVKKKSKLKGILNWHILWSDAYPLLPRLTSWCLPPPASIL